MNQPNALTADQMAAGLNQIFERLGELKIEGNQAQLLLNIRTAVAQINNSLIHYMQEASKKDFKCNVNGEAKCAHEPEAPLAA